MVNVRWIVQKNLTNPETLNIIKRLCVSSGTDYEEILVVPFSDSADCSISADCIPVFYGSTTHMLNAYRRSDLKRGVFFDEDAFCVSNYVNQWGDDTANSDGMFVSIRELPDVSGLDDNTSYFIRPNGDTKLFSGGVERWGDFKKTAAEIMEYHPHAGLDTMICMASLKQSSTRPMTFLFSMSP